MSNDQQYEANIREVQRSLYGLTNSIASDNLGDKDECLEHLRSAVQSLGWAIDELKEDDASY